ncbi:hypothetical protein EYF80_058325 [Liparis tanakae]|uniref:Uncharacterized protein n=1 Tax=Liparis tanakae TaxID=230148 RepID=A0A4Z2ERQ4_9TELE|nr:hypothetical protein EYF80_058325 [Liparis tanakae]
MSSPSGCRSGCSCRTRCSSSEPRRARAPCALSKPSGSQLSRSVLLSSCPLELHSAHRRRGFKREHVRFDQGARAATRPGPGACLWRQDVSCALPTRALPATERAPGDSSSSHREYKSLCSVKTSTLKEDSVSPDVLAQHVHTDEEQLRQMECASVCRSVVTLSDPPRLPPPLNTWSLILEVTQEVTQEDALVAPGGTAACFEVAVWLQRLSWGRSLGSSGPRASCTRCRRWWVTWSRTPCSRTGQEEQSSRRQHVAGGFILGGEGAMKPALCDAPHKAPASWRIYKNRAISRMVTCSWSRSGQRPRGAQVMKL